MSKKLNCRLIVSDFDGTLANSENGVDEEVKEAIKNYIADGGIFAVCTGRILPSILPRVRQLGLEGLVVASQGSTVAEISTGKIIRDVTLTPEQTSEICAVLEELKANVQIYDVNGFYTDVEEGAKYLKIYEDITAVKAKRADVPLSEFVIKSGMRCNKVATICSPEAQPELYKKLCARLADKFDVTCSASVLIEVSPLGETKGSALKYLAARFGVPIEKTCAIGDNLNDLSMLLTAGYGVAVANACKEVLDKAKYVTVTNDCGAVAKVIEDYGYAKN